MKLSALVVAASLVALTAAPALAQDVARDVGHRVAQTGRAVGHAGAGLGRSVGHATAQTGRDVTGNGPSHRAMRHRHHRRHHHAR